MRIEAARIAEMQARREAMARPRFERPQPVGPVFQGGGWRRMGR